MLSKFESSANIALTGILSALERHSIFALTNAQGCIAYANDRLCEVSGYSREELLGKGLHDVSAWEHSPEVVPAIYDVAEKDGFWQGELCNLAKDGHQYWLRATISVVRDAQDQPAMFAAICTDITSQKEILEQLELLQACMARTNDVIVITEAAPLAKSGPRIIYVNEAFHTLTGYSREEVIGNTPRLLQGPDSNRATLDRIHQALTQSTAVHEEVLNYTKDKREFWAELNISPITNKAGVHTHWVAVQRVITERKMAEAQAYKLAFYDSLTGLPNRRLLIDRLRHAVASSSRSGMTGALFFIDLDAFRTLNDTLGHDMGDQLLQQVTTKLIECVREGDTIARFGGDEFAIILEDLSADLTDAALGAEQMGHKIAAALNAPYQIHNKEYLGTASVGVTFFGPNRPSAEELLKQAEIAMYAAKNAGRKTLRFFDPKMQQTIALRVAMEEGLSKALERKEFRLYYQIKVNEAGQPVGAEALLRWIRPNHGVVAPSQFIPLAEETRLIIPIGKWVLETACAQLKVWQSHPDTQDMTLSVNVSAIQFRDPDFVSQVRDIFLDYGIEPNRLMLELTESILVMDVGQTISKISELRSLGIPTSLDDFGTGYSSLQYLKQLPLGQLKIDQSFVRGMAGDQQEKSIVQTIIVLAKSLGMDVIAEGVETEEQRQLLLDEGCSKFQGFLFGKPMPIEEFMTMFETV